MRHECLKWSKMKMSRSNVRNEPVHSIVTPNFYQPLSDLYDSRHDRNIRSINSKSRKKKLHCDSGLFHSIQGLIFPQTQPITIWWIDLTSVKIGPEHREGVVWAQNKRYFCTMDLWTTCLALSMKFNVVIFWGYIPKLGVNWRVVLRWWFTPLIASAKKIEVIGSRSRM